MTRAPNTLPVTFSGVKALREFLVNYEGSWRRLVWEFGGRVSISTLRRIASGRYIPRRAETLRALHLPITVAVPVCPRHGIVHRGRCPRKTFEEHAAEYDTWKREKAAQLLEMIGEP